MILFQDESLKQVSRRSQTNTLAGYFLAGRRMKWWMVGLSLFVSNIGNAIFVGIAGAAASRGFPVVAYEFSATFCLLLLGNLFMPVYISSKVFTMPEYIQKRYGGTRLPVLMAITMMVAGITAALCGEMYAGVILIQEVLGWHLYGSLCVILALTAIYTISGGLTAVVYTDAVQSILILIGSLILSIIALTHVGAPNLYDMYMSAIPNETVANSSCGVPQESDWHIFQPANDPQYPWPGTGFGILLLSCYYWCTNQIIVQRSLASKSLNQAKMGSVLAGYLKIVPMLIMVYPGMISRALFPDEVACQTPESCMKACGNPNGCSDTAYPKLILTLMPTGLKGLLLAAMLSALLTTMTSIFNSLSTLFTLDIWTKIRRSPSDRELLIVGRIATAVVAVVAVLWLPVIQAFGAGELFLYIQSVSSYLYPPVFAIFVVGVLWERATEKGAFAALVIGVLLGGLRFVCDFLYETPGCGQPDTRPEIIKKLPFLHFALLLFAVCLTVLFLVSLMTAPLPKEKLVRLTWWTRNEPAPRNSEKSVELAAVDEENEKETDAEPTSNPSKGEVALRYLCCLHDGPGSSKKYSEVDRSEKNSSTRSSEYRKKYSRMKTWLININTIICFCAVTAVYIIFG